VSLCGREIDYWSNLDIGKACDIFKLPYTRTDKGHPSFTADWLEAPDHPFFNQLVAARRLDRAGSVFIRSKILNENINGRVHPQFTPVKNDHGGTRTG